MAMQSESVSAFGISHPQRYLSRETRPGVGRLVRFGVIGAVTFGLQVGLLMLLKDIGLGAIFAYALGLAAAVQFNFAFNQLFVWDDRPICALWSRAALERWLTFQGCIAFSLVLNLGVFVAARLFMNDLMAAAAGVGLSTAVKFLSLDRLAFREDALVAEDVLIDQRV